MCSNGGVGFGVGGIGDDNGVGGVGGGGGGGDDSDEIVARGPQGICMQYFSLEGLNSPLGGIGGGSCRGRGSGCGGFGGGEGNDVG